jgi:hypothetical protein
MPTRRQATPEEIQRINDHLADLEMRLEAQKPAGPPVLGAALPATQSAQTTAANAPS